MADGAQPHRHAWQVVDFVLHDGRPMVRQACACGAERRIRAWERYWEPLADGRAARGRSAGRPS